jgi:hypothetical protein
MLLYEVVEVVQLVVNAPQTLCVVILAPALHVLPTRFDRVIAMSRIFIEDRIEAFLWFLHHFKSQIFAWQRTRNKDGQAPKFKICLFLSPVYFFSVDLKVLIFFKTEKASPNDLKPQRFWQIIFYSLLTVFREITSLESTFGLRLLVFCLILLSGNSSSSLKC